MLAPLLVFFVLLMPPCARQLFTARTRGAAMPGACARGVYSVRARQLAAARRARDAASAAAMRPRCRVYERVRRVMRACAFYFVASEPLFCRCDDPSLMIDYDNYYD